jgi:hypothetical protein
VLERHLVREPVDRLRTPLGIEFIAELTSVGAQRISQLARIGVHVPEGLVVVDRERTERLASARLGFSAHGTLKRSNFGIDIGIPAPGSTMGVFDEVTIDIETEFTGPALAPA